MYFVCTSLSPAGISLWYICLYVYLLCICSLCIYLLVDGINGDPRTALPKAVTNPPEGICDLKIDRIRGDVDEKMFFFGIKATAQISDKVPKSVANTKGIWGWFWNVLDGRLCICGDSRVCFGKKMAFISNKRKRCRFSNQWQSAQMSNEYIGYLFGITAGFVEQTNKWIKNE